MIGTNVAQTTVSNFALLFSSPCLHLANLSLVYPSSLLRSPYNTHTQVCDYRCGSGKFGDYNCNWRDRGAHCRFCFDDHDAAIVADKAAQRIGGRVIM